MSHLELRLRGDLAKRKLRIEAVGGDKEKYNLGVANSKEIDADSFRVLRLPLENTCGKPSRIREIALYLEGEGQAHLAIDSVRFSGESTRPKKPGDFATKKGAKLRRAMWVWETRNILSHASEVDELLAFAKRNNLTDLYVQIPYEYIEGKVLLDLVTPQRAFNKKAAKAGIKIHALDGDPKFIHSDNHERMLKFVEALIGFNNSGNNDEAYRAIHLDNEPYVLKQWRNDNERQVVIQDYIDLNRKLSPLIRQAGMEFGVDIPFWWGCCGGEGKSEIRL